MSKYFERQLEELHVQLITLGSYCEKAISLSAKAISAAQNEEMARQVFDTDRDIDAKEREIENLCMSLLLHQHPVARDLREISAALKMVSDMERIGDQAADIADLSLYIAKNASSIPETITKMAEDTVTMVTESVDSFVKSDLELCRNVIRNDDLVDDAFNEIKSKLADMIYGGNLDAKTGLDLLMTAKYFERIGDHASDIAELILRIKSEHAYHIVKHLPLMAEEARKMVHDAVEAFISQDLEETEKIIRMDDRVDSLFNQVKTDVISLLKTSPDQADQGIDLLMVAKYLERIGDHAVNVCEWTEFSKTGALKHVRIM